jgi:hypothetical protein
MPSKIAISFEADDVSQLRDQMVAFLLASPLSSTGWEERQTAGLVEAPSDPEEAADAEIPDAEWDVKHAPKARKARTAKVAPPPEPELKPAPVLKPAVEPPPLDVLKAVVTKAVKADQKSGNGSSSIRTLLPAFKAETGLDFIANATEAHRGALFKLVEAAGLTV